MIGSTPGQNNRSTFAKNSIHLTNAYVIPDDQIVDAFIDAARWGVDIEIILPASSDSLFAINAVQYNYLALLQAGVKIYERRNALLHAKTAVSDGVWSPVGSTNSTTGACSVTTR